MLSDPLFSNTLRPLFSHQLSLKLETIKLDAFIKNYSPGQVLQGRVTQTFPESKALVEIKGDNILMQFPRPASVGESISLKIEQIQPHPVLKLIAPPSNKPESLPTPVQTSSPPPREGHQPEPKAVNAAADKTSIQSEEKPSAPNVIPGKADMKKEAAEVTRQPPSADAKGSKPAPSVPREVTRFTRTQLQQLGLQEGRGLTGEVIQARGEQTVLVKVQGKQAVIRNFAGPDIRPGFKVQIQARPDGAGGFVLDAEPASAPTLNASVLKNYLPHRQPLTVLLSSLKQVLDQMPPAAFKSAGIESGQLEKLQDNILKLMTGEINKMEAPQLKEIVERTGIHYEAKIRDFLNHPVAADKRMILEYDLKGQLMRLSRQLEQMSTGIAEPGSADKITGKLASQVLQAVNTIELQQLVHYFSRQEHHPLLLHLPENLMGSDSAFKVYIRADSEGPGSSGDPNHRVFNLVFLLNLSALGDLRIETRLHKEELSIHILGSSTEVVQFIQQHIPELEETLKERGFSISIVSRHQPEISLEAPPGLDQLLIDTPMKLVDLKT
ncbi:MAG: hypothetical protein GWM98_27915 [Nitrospinaceae bacterium]|nr:hypothetical protein [Nitrospinaceae bacterium]NIR57581.1 hypothetical protein [Nitrospinaceae bacterium]NIS88051.1 hypothetical protein [Nitrospinaceae bacterium]NIT84915.1 hypothetical protein [Nitrospinaceae bacterium]NIU47091.1 hypothetical protein [Nitrospinaceae bacterium]